MDSLMQQLIDQLAHGRAEVHAAVDAVPPELRERRPSPDRWSVAEVLEHLSIVETRVIDRFNTIIAEAPAAVVPADQELAPPPTDVNMAALLDRSRALTAPLVLHPSGLSAEAAWAALEESRRRFRGFLDGTSEAALGTLRMRHPVFGELTLYQWIGTVAGHEARHAAQIREIGTTVAARG